MTTADKSIPRSERPAALVEVRVLSAGYGALAAVRGLDLQMLVVPAACQNGAETTDIER
jgi:hypothetical protein